MTTAQGPALSLSASRATHCDPEEALQTTLASQKVLLRRTEWSLLFPLSLP